MEVPGLALGGVLLPKPISSIFILNLDSECCIHNLFHELGITNYGIKISLVFNKSGY